VGVSFNPDYHPPSHPPRPVECTRPVRTGARWPVLCARLECVITIRHFHLNSSISLEILRCRFCRLLCRAVQDGLIPLGLPSAIYLIRRLAMRFNRN